MSTSETAAAVDEAFEPAAAEPTAAPLPDGSDPATPASPEALEPPEPASLASDPDDDQEPTDAEGLPTF